MERPEKNLDPFLMPNCKANTHFGQEPPRFFLRHISILTPPLEELCGGGAGENCPRMLPHIVTMQGRSPEMDRLHSGFHLSTPVNSRTHTAKKR